MPGPGDVNIVVFDQKGGSIFLSGEEIKLGPGEYAIPMTPSIFTTKKVTECTIKHIYLEREIQEFLGKLKARVYQKWGDTTIAYQDGIAQNNYNNELIPYAYQKRYLPKEIKTGTSTITVSAKHHDDLLELLELLKKSSITNKYEEMETWGFSHNYNIKIDINTMYAGALTWMIKLRFANLLVSHTFNITRVETPESKANKIDYLPIEMTQELAKVNKIIDVGIIEKSI